MAFPKIGRIWRIYKITCTITQKSYVGLTVNSVDQRWSNHVCQAVKKTSRFSIFHRAIRKYRRNAFFIETLCEVTSFEEACTAERAAIIEHKTLTPNGYNIAHGGAGTPGFSKPHTAQTRAKISLAHKGKVFSEETKKKMSLARKGIVISEETRKKYAATSAARIWSPESRAKISASKSGKTFPVKSINMLKKCFSDPSSNRGIHKEHNKWHVRIGINGRRIYVGVFNTIEEARSAHREAVRKRISELEQH